jgi:hypothetical protein
VGILGFGIKKPQIPGECVVANEVAGTRTPLPLLAAYVVEEEEEQVAEENIDDLDNKWH